VSPAELPWGEPLLHVFLGTKAQYIKTAPLLLLLEERHIPHRLIDSGQHSDIGRQMREEFGIREPDMALEQRGGDVTSITQAIGWASRLAAGAMNRQRLREEVFGGHGGICVVHGDTPSTLIAAVMARRAGLRVAHLEAGLRSGSYLHPFPEEIIRVLTMRRAQLLFAPGAEAADNLRGMGVSGRIVDTGANTVEEALVAVLDSDRGETGAIVVATMHRVENLKSRRRVEGFVALLERVAADHDVLFVAHGPTIEVMERGDLFGRLRRAGVTVRPLMPHGEFARAISAAPFVITDGGSIQEECALLGVPTLLWRDRTERSDGLGANVVLSRYSAGTIDVFLAEPELVRRDSQPMTAQPSVVILETLLDELDHVLP
jgi:UDP-N-acetylglucosamine 2-epimerase (non-hydrolysing)